MKQASKGKGGGGKKGMSAQEQGCLTVPNLDLCSLEAI